MALKKLKSMLFYGVDFSKCIDNFTCINLPTLSEQTLKSVKLILVQIRTLSQGNKVQTFSSDKTGRIEKKRNEIESTN